MRRARRRSLIAVTALTILALAAAGCGVGFGSGDSSTEVFRDLVLTRAQDNSGRIDVRLDYQQPYDVDVGVACYMKQGGERLAMIGNFTIKANAEGGRVGDVTPVPDTFLVAFRPPAPGHYQVTCLTPADENNEITADVDYP